MRVSEEVNCQPKSNVNPRVSRFVVISATCMSEKIWLGCCVQKKTFIALFGKILWQSCTLVLICEKSTSPKPLSCNARILAKTKMLKWRSLYLNLTFSHLFNHCLNLKKMPAIHSQADKLVDGVAFDYNRESSWILNAVNTNLLLNKTFLNIKLYFFQTATEKILRWEVIIKMG